MRKIFVFFTSFLFLLLIFPNKVIGINEIRQERKEVRQERQAGQERQKLEEERKEFRQELQKRYEERYEKQKNLMEKIKDRLGRAFRFQARITGEITAIGDNSLTVSADGTNYQVNITSETQLFARFGGKTQLSEFSVGNKVNVIGSWANEERTAINAKVIRNQSIQRRWGAFLGKVISKSSDSFVIESVNRGRQTVYFTPRTKFINRRGETISFADVQEGHRVRVKGVWDRALNKIIEVEEVKNFSLPPLPTKVVTPTVTQ